MLQCAECFAATDGDIVLRQANRNFKKKALYTILPLFQLQLCFSYFVLD